MVVLDGNFALGCEPGTDCPWTHIFQFMLERTDAITNEVLEPITFVLAYLTVYCTCSDVGDSSKSCQWCVAFHSLLTDWFIGYSTVFISRRCCLASLRRADRLSRGALPNAVRRCAGSRNLKNEGAIPRVGPQRHKENMLSVQQYD